MAHSLTRMNDRESRAWISLVSTTELLPTALDAQLQRDSELTHYEFIVLSTLQRERRAMRLSDLATATNATLPRASKVLTRLESRGIVERIPSPVDKRAVDVVLTTVGRRVLVRATPKHFETVRELVLDRLTDEQLDALADALEPVLAALDPHQRLKLRTAPSED